MFRLQNNVPEVYPDKSRDFQMFCRLFDVSFNSVKQSIDSLQYATDTLLCDSSILPLLKTKLGFFSDIELSDKELRYILQAFPTLIRYKGSYQALVYVSNLYSRLIGHADSIRVIHNRDDFKIEVSSEEGISRSQVLFELLKYVLPTGYVIDYFITKYHDSGTQLVTTNSLVYNTHPVEYSFYRASTQLINLNGGFTSYKYLIRGRLTVVENNYVEIVDPYNEDLYPKMIIYGDEECSTSPLAGISSSPTVGAVVSFWGEIGGDQELMVMKNGALLENKLTVVVHSDIATGQVVDESKELPKIVNMAHIEGDV